jgi:hypothetical protein
MPEENAGLYQAIRYAVASLSVTRLLEELSNILERRGQRDIRLNPTIRENKINII